VDGLFYLISIVAVGLVMWWVVQNDKVPPNRPTSGLFAMLPGRELVRRRRLRGWTLGTEDRPQRRPRL
jgi:hypothetical protein